jgi:hypothetical protein
MRDTTLLAIPIIPKDVVRTEALMVKNKIYKASPPSYLRKEDWCSAVFSRSGDQVFLETLLSEAGRARPLPGGVRGALYDTLTVSLEKS